MKVVIFGGGGFIGSAITDNLLKLGYSVRIFERAGILPYREFGANENVEWLSGDILSKSDIMDAMAGVEVVIHLVSTTVPKSSNDDPIFDVNSNIIGTLQILECMVAQRISRIVFSSSGGTVYGNPEMLPINESHPTNPFVSYGITKLACEKYILLYERLYGIKAVILRISNPFGQRQRMESAQGAIAVFMSRALKRLPVEIWGDGSVVRDYIHVSDVSEAFVNALNYNGNFRVFNISSGVGVSINELLVKIENIVGTTIEKTYHSGRSCDSLVNVLCCKLARDELHWSPSLTLDSGLSITVDWMRSLLVEE